MKRSHIKLERGQVFKVPREFREVILKCASGRAWITSSNDPEDHILSAGAEISLATNKAIVIEGLGDKLEIDILLCA